MRIRNTADPAARVLTFGKLGYPGAVMTWEIALVLGIGGRCGRSVSGRCASMYEGSAKLDRRGCQPVSLASGDHD